MGVITLAQTNGLVASYNAGSSGATDGDVTVGADMTAGGSLGSTEFQPQTALGTDLDRGCIRWLSTAVIGQTTWQSGNYLVPINITLALKDNFVEEVHVDELQDDGTTYVNVANITAQQVSTAATGVLPDATGFVVNRATNFTPKNADSKLSITVVFQSDLGHGSVVVGVTPDQTIATPIDDGLSDVFIDHRVNAISHQQQPLTAHMLGGALLE